MLDLRHRLERLTGIGPDPFLPEPALEAIYRGLFLRELARLGEEDTFYPVGGAANYSLLYLILRIGLEFRPQSVLDVGAGQSTLLWSALHRHGLVGEVLTLEDNEDWAARIGNQVQHRVVTSPLRQVVVNGRQTDTYDWEDAVLARHFDVIVCDGPRGVERHSRRGVLTMLTPEKLGQDFVLLLDDVERRGEQDTVDAIHRHLQSAAIPYAAGVVRAAKTQMIFAGGRFRPVTFL